MRLHGDRGCQEEEEGVFHSAKDGERKMMLRNMMMEDAHGFEMRVIWPVWQITVRQA